MPNRNGAQFLVSCSRVALHIVTWIWADLTGNISRLNLRAHRIATTLGGTPKRTVISLLVYLSRFKGCVFVCLCVCLFVCLLACLFVCLFVCLLVCLLACLFACLLAGLFVCCLLVCLFICLSVCFSFRMCVFGGSPKQGVLTVPTTS